VTTHGVGRSRPNPAEPNAGRLPTRSRSCGSGRARRKSCARKSGSLPSLALGRMHCPTWWFPFSDLGCYVSLPASARFSGGTILFGASIRGPLGWICSSKDGRRLRAVEVRPAGLHRASALDERIRLTNSFHTFEGLAEDVQRQIPDLRVLDYSRARAIQPPAQGHPGVH
jgi:hypothetical protein